MGIGTLVLIGRQGLRLTGGIDIEAEGIVALSAAVPSRQGFPTIAGICSPVSCIVPNGIARAEDIVGSAFHHLPVSVGGDAPTRRTKPLVH